jgi:hypothetical protein
MYRKHLLTKEGRVEIFFAHSMLHLKKLFEWEMDIHGLGMHLEGSMSPMILALCLVMCTLLRLTIFFQN